MRKKQNPAWFVTGTDTEVGKTFVSCALLHAMRQRGWTALGMKPVAAGCDAEGKNEDVEQLLAASSRLGADEGATAPRELVNPYAFSAAIAPHIAAAEEGRTIELAHIVAAFEQLHDLADAVLVEGVGGFCVPLGTGRAAADTADLAVALDLPVILVVGMRLGCISHALLTAQAIAARGLQLVGWVANRIDPAMSRFEENLAALQERIGAPLLGVVAYGTTPEAAAATLDLPGQARTT